MLDIWLAAAEGTLLGFGAQRVIALRAMKIVAGGSSARSELSRMMTEKVSATAGAEGRCPGSTASKVYGFWAALHPKLFINSMVRRGRLCRGLARHGQSNGSPRIPHQHHRDSRSR
jgi:hypothetical protein